MYTRELVLPEHWAPYLFNGDSSGYEDSEIEAIGRLHADLGLPAPSDVSEGSEDFRRYHAANSYGILACNVATYTYLMPGDEPQLLAAEFTSCSLEASRKSSKL